jgi:hypothetical protein
VIDPTIRATIETFGERVEMLVLAYIDKHGKRPVIVYEDLRTSGQMYACVDPIADGSRDDVVPSLAELAKHGARAWKIWTKDADPDKTAILVRVTPDGSSVAIVPRSEEVERGIAMRANEIETFLSKHRD